MSALHKLLHQIVDYAGLFPPAGLPMAAVIKNYEKYVPDPHQWMLARLIVPASRLEEFATTFLELFPGGLDQRVWQISALIPTVDAPENAFASALQAIDTFHQNHSFAEVDTVEGKLTSTDQIDATLAGLPDSLSAFLEIPHADPGESIRQLAAASRPHTFAKIRTGGVTEDLIPSPAAVARFIDCCARSRLGFKATAGLHHPLRDEYALTYQTDSVRGTMHGFINVFLAACMARIHNWPVDRIEKLLMEDSAGAILIEDDGIRYDGQHVSAADMEAVRSDFAISFGSCSFVEPVEDLQKLGWLADGTKTV